MEDPRLGWEMVNYYPACFDEEEKEDESVNKSSKFMGWILNRGVSFGKNVVIAGVVMSSVPLVLPPLLVISALGFAFSVPFGVVFASYACTEKLMSKLLPSPTSLLHLDYQEEDKEGIHEYDEGHNYDLTKEDGLNVEVDGGPTEHLLEYENERPSNLINGAVDIPEAEAPSVDSTSTTAAKTVEAQNVTNNVDTKDVKSNVEAQNVINKKSTVEAQNVTNNVDTQDVKSTVEAQDVANKVDIKDVKPTVEAQNVASNVDAKDVESSDKGKETPTPNLISKGKSSSNSNSNSNSKGRKKLLHGKKKSEPNPQQGKDKSNTTATGVPEDKQTQLLPPAGDNQSRMNDKKEIPAGMTEQGQSLVSDEGDEKIWKKLDAVRVIVGFKAARHPSYFEELKALYLFTGIEPPSSSIVGEDTSDLSEFHTQLSFLMSVIGLK